MAYENVEYEKAITITNRGMITIPAVLRKRYHLNDGNQVVIIEDEGTLRIIPITPIETLRTMSVPAEEMLKELKKSHAEELERENR